MHSEDDYIGEKGFWEEDDEDEVTTKGTRKRGTRSRAMAVPKERFAGHNIGSSSLRREKNKGGIRWLGDDRAICHEPFCLKVPPYPIPRSWLKTVMEMDTRTTSDYVGHHYAELDILSLKNRNDFFLPNNKEKVYSAILMDPPFDTSIAPVDIQNPSHDTSARVTMEDFKKIPMTKIVPDGQGAMLFIWTPTELTLQVNAVCESWGYLLVEHGSWLYRGLDWGISNRESNLHGLSKVNLLLFRRCKKNFRAYTRLEIRHQRTSDSYYDFERYHPKTGRLLKSKYHYRLVEKMLPALDDKEKGRALFLWAPKSERRNGWTCISDTRHLQMMDKNKDDMDIGDW